MSPTELKEKTVKDQEILDQMKAVVPDQDAKHMGIAKAGGQWFKNDRTETIYRVDKSENGYEVKETKQSDQSDIRKTTTTELSRKELMEQAKDKKIKYFRIMSKGELVQAVSKEMTQEKLEVIQNEAIKRWKK